MNPHHPRHPLQNFDSRQSFMNLHHPRHPRQSLNPGPHAKIPTNTKILWIHMLSCHAKIWPTPRTNRRTHATHAIHFTHAIWQIHADIAKLEVSKHGFFFANKTSNI